jgi:dihydrofolate reductase
MAKLVCTGITSLDGYTADEQGRFDWSRPDAEVHAFVNDRERAIGTYLMGRRMYEVMRVWDDLAEEPGISEEERDFAAGWLDTDKVVYSEKLTEVATVRTRLERRFDPVEIERMKARSERDLAISGPTLAAHAIRAGIVDEFQLFVNPVVVGGGTSFLPDGVRIELELLEEHRFGNGVVFLRYRNITA